MDQLQQAVPCLVRSDYEGAEVELGQGQCSRYITGCEKLAFNAYSMQQNYSTLIIRGEILCSDSRWDTLKIHVKIGSCPLGFQKIEDRCECDARLNRSFDTIKCDIDTNLITINNLGWFSYDGGYLRIHKNCPLNYCSSNRNGTCLYDPDTLCENHHSGILCGRYVANYSLVLGSWKCRQCSHLSRYNFIWLTVILALAGMVLVVFLLLVKIVKKRTLSIRLLAIFIAHNTYPHTLPRVGVSYLELCQ